MKEVTVQDLKNMMDNGADFQLVDVREQNEYDFVNLDGDLVPMSTIRENVEKIAKDKQVVVHCRSGKRSADVINFLEQNHGYNNLYNLVGGILAWSDEIDPEVPKY
jgi:adenylyltransferase/sulfurtransferase